jgi:ribosomal biogenesis protein LAS1
LTRLINSLVDPLQTRTYARPITHIARELGLPEGLVALRHAVTHEDLPALEVLRTGAEQALEWLRVRVVGPAVFDSLPVEEKEQWDGEEAFRAALGKYKRLMKQYYRQRTSKASTTGGWEGARELRMTLREVEDLVGAAVEGKDDDVREKVGRRVVQVLLGEEGGMIPSLR